MTAPIEARPVNTPPTTFATFVVVTVDDAEEALDAVRDTLSGIDDVMKNVGYRDLDDHLSCIVGIGARVWSALTRRPLPAQLHPFRVVEGARHTAPGTPGDVLLYLRANRRDLVFEAERQILAQFGSAVRVVDEATGFRSFDMRDLLGFVDGTADPVGDALVASTLVGDGDAAYAGGSYVVVQKYLHPLDAWQQLTTEQQESIIGRTKLDNTELADAATGQKSHKTLATIKIDGVEYDILRDNMPFGSPAAGEFGTYFIGYSRSLAVIERMLERMFIGDPPGLHDRLLDFSTAVTGSTFFARSATFLRTLADPPDAARAHPMTIDEYLYVGAYADEDGAGGAPDRRG